MITSTQPLFVTPVWAERFSGRLVVAQSTRHGGVSPAPYASLNLGHSTDDDPLNVSENRRRLAAALGFPADRIASVHQVHGASVVHVSEPGRWPNHDALITNFPEVYLTVSVADCVPVLIYDPVQQAVGAAHAGWRGTVEEIAYKTLDAMAFTFGTRPADCWAYIGACIDECDFEVDADVADHFSDTYKRRDEMRDKFFVDLKAANRDQLERAGVPAEQVEVSPFSTVTHSKDFFSHRADGGKTGRGIGVIGVRA